VLNGTSSPHVCSIPQTYEVCEPYATAAIIVDIWGVLMSLPVAIAVIVVLDVALLGSLAWIMSQPRHLTSHRHVEPSHEPVGQIDVELVD